MLNRSIARIVFYLVALTLLTWTASLTYSFLSNALPDAFWLVPLFGLVVFDGGMIAWLIVFLSHAEGAIQRAVAICLCIFDLVGVSLMVVAEILLGGQQLVQAPELLGAAAIWGVGIWTVVNVAGLIFFHLGDPEARKEMSIQAEKDAIWEGALEKLKQRRIEDESRLAAELSDVMFRQLVSELRADRDGDGVPDVVQRGRQTGNNTQLPETPVDINRALSDLNALVAHYSANGTGQGGNDAPRP